jgi:transposase-like protein
MPHRPAAVAVPAPRSSFVGFRFPPEVIMLAVRWYLRYGLSYRDVEELLAERGIAVDHVTIYRWVQRFTPELIDAARPSPHAAGDRWFVDETYLKSPDTGCIYTGRSTSTGRSSTLWPPQSGTWEPPDGSSPRS